MNSVCLQSEMSVAIFHVVPFSGVETQDYCRHDGNRDRIRLATDLIAAAGDERESCFLYKKVTNDNSHSC